MQNTVKQSSLIELAVNRMAWARGFTDSLIESLSDEQVMVRPDGKANHAIWITGHLASTDDFILSLLNESQMTLPESWHDLFKSGSKPQDDPAVYPSRREIREACTSMRERMIEWVRSLEESQFNDPTPETLQPFADTKLGLPFTIAAHDLFHAGQVAAVRSCLGMDPLHR